MMSREQVIRALACLIDADSPPGLAANALARAVVSLVECRETPTVVMLTSAIERISASHPRGQFEIAD